MREATDWELRNLKGIVYLIHNKTNHKCYVGETVKTFIKRYSLGLIEFGTTTQITSQYLIDSINKYGISNFSIHILEKDKTLEELDYLEKFYAEFYNCYAPNGYNMSKCGVQHDEKAWDKRSKEYEFLDDGRYIKVKNLTKFCRDNGLIFTAMCEVSSGVRKNYKKWTKYIEGINNSYGSIKIKYIVKSPTGEIKNIYNLEKFCTENDLCQRGIQALVSGKLATSSGYTLVENRLHPHKKPKIDKSRIGVNAKVFKIRFPDMSENEILNLTQFCKIYNLNYKYFHDSRKCNGYEII